MNKDVSEFKKMWKENHHPDNEVELVKASDVEMLIRLTDELYEQCKLFERMLECGFPSNVSAQYNMLAQVRELLAKVDGGDEG